MKHNLYFYLLILLFVIGTLSVSQVSVAQQPGDDGDGTIFYKTDIDHYPRQAMWSSDSQRFSFFSRSKGPALLKMPDDSWVNYVVGAQTLSYASEWQLQADLTPAELQLLDPAISEDGDESVRFASPSGEYIVCLCGGITLYSRTQRQLAHTDYTAMDPFSGPDQFYVLWSEDESAFVFTVSYDPGDAIASGYVTNYAQNVENTTALRVEPLIEGKLYRFLLDGIDDRRFKVQDLSSDGKQVLLTARYDDPGNYDTYSLPFFLIVWDTTDSDASILIDDVDPETFLAASFVYGSDSAVLILTSEGLFHYDLATGVKTLLPLVVQRTDQVHFSPNGRYLASICCRDSDYSAYQLQIIDLTQAVELPNTPPSANAGGD